MTHVLRSWALAFALSAAALAAPAQAQPNEAYAKVGAAFGTAVTELRALADKNDARAHYYLATMHLSGLIVPKDEKLAFEHFQKAAAAGDAESEYLIGLFHWHGIHTAPKDQVKARASIKKAADKNLKAAKAALLILE